MSKTAFIFGAKTEGLNYTYNDLTLVSEAFSKHNYQVVRPRWDGDQHDVIRELNKAALNTYPEDTLVLYFSGHGIVESGKLFLIYKDNARISISAIFDTLLGSLAKNKLIILDTCSSGTAASDWPYSHREEENYCLLTATKSLMPAKELDEYQASFLSFHIHKALTAQYPLDNENRITARTLLGYLEKAQQEYNTGSKPVHIEKPHLYGGDDLEIAKSEKNVCVISSEYPPKIVGGLGVHVYELTSELAGLDVNQDLILPSLTGKYPCYKDPGPDKKNLKLHQSNTYGGAAATYGNPYSWLRFASDAMSVIERLNPKPDVIHCHDWVTVLAGLALRWKLKIPLVFHLHLPNKSDFCSSIENLGLICADTVTVNSSSIKDDIHQRFPNEGIDVKIISNGVNITDFQPCDDWPKSDNYILFVGRLVPQKGIEYLIRAFYYAAQKYPELTLKIVGEGEQEYLLKQLCVNYMIDEKVKFTGFKKGKDLVRLYQKAKFVVVPSIYEPFGMTVLEAMACKRPVIASNLMGLQENVKHGETGYLFAKEDHLDLAQWIIKMMSDEKLMNTMGANGRNYIDTNKLNWNDIAKQYLNVYANMPASQMDFTISPIAYKFKEQIMTQGKAYSDKYGIKHDYLDNLFSFMK